MLTNQELIELVKKGKEQSQKRRFTESVELIITLKDIDLKKTDLNINEIVYLPHPVSKKPKICFVGSGDLALRAKNAGVDGLIDPSQLENYAGNKRQAKKLVRTYDFFLAETSLMPRIGRILGQYLGPKGKIPMPVPPNAPIEAIIQRMRSAVRVRSRGSLGIAAKVGDMTLSETELAENVFTVIQTIERKLPAGERNIKSIIVKTTMGNPVKKVVEHE